MQHSGIIHRILVCLLAVAVLQLANPAYAQTTYGSILGTITDTSGGVIAGAAVSVTNIGTSERKQVTSDASGNYRFLQLPPGRYRVDVESPGFKHLTRDQVLLEVQGAIRIDPALEVGDTRQVVEVQGLTPLLQSESATLSQVVESKTVNEMPLNGRNVFSLMSLVPGVVPQGNTGGAVSTLHPNERLTSRSAEAWRIKAPVSSMGRR
jgi:hypothetical protein